MLVAAGCGCIGRNTLSSVSSPILSLRTGCSRAQLLDPVSVTQALRCKIQRHVNWTDSSAFLGWLRLPNKTKPFVANIVTAILDLTECSSWRHVPISENPPAGFSIVWSETTNCCRLFTLVVRP